jgi:CRISPR-associated protein Csd1
LLARATVRSAEDLRADVYDALAGAALGGETPAALLAPTLHRLRIAAVESGRNIRYHASRFALLKLILNRSNAGGPRSMTITRQLSETNDPSYNCGRLLAVLDDIQAAALDDVGADILARYYGRASTVPRNVFPSLIQLAQAHLKKIRTGKPGLEVLLDRKLALILALFAPDGPDGCPDFPGLMDPRMQGRFALGFYQQKAADQRERDAKAAEKARAKVNATPDDQ